MTWTVHKFGGTSVGNADRYRAIPGILGNVQDGKQRAIVVSAMKGVTDDLLNLVVMAQSRNQSYLQKIEDIRQRHMTCLDALLKEGAIKTELKNKINHDLNEISEILRGVWLVKVAPERVSELIAGYGEVWSAQILNAHYRELGIDSQWMDAREVLVVERDEKTVNIDWVASQAKIDNWIKTQNKKIIIVTGFVASTREGVATILGRNGSDYSASIFGALLKASEILIWTDVDGVMSADPRLVPEAIVLDEMSYQEISELAYFGAKVVHPATMEPAVKRKIPIWIRNTFNPNHPGTKIHAESKSTLDVKGFSAISNMSLINVEGMGMAGVPGVAQRLFGALSAKEISVVMISQASSEHSICIAIPQDQEKTAIAAVEQAFYREIHQGMVNKVTATQDCSILAVVGDNMVNRPGIAARFFSALGKAGINIHAISQGSSERNISVVIAGSDTTRALRAVHSSFYLSKQTISVGIIGVGLIGKEFLGQLMEQLPALRGDRNIDIRVRALANSKSMLLNEKQIDLPTWENQFSNKSQPIDYNQFADHLLSGQLPHAVIIDATASADIPKHYTAWIKKGINIITPNKKANAASFASYNELRQVTRQTNHYFLYSTNVGAGLPIIQTLKDLHNTGDKFLKIEGIFSGTLSFIFNNYDGSKPFSEVVLKAKELGYTEPDPRDDLSGTDVARKLVILAREAGLRIELEDIKIESLVPQNLQTGDVQTYIQKLPTQDQAMHELLEKNKKLGKVIRYVGAINSKGEATVSLQAYDQSHPFARLQGSDNIVAFQTKRYDKQPLYIQGPGAGPAVTAAGVFADLLRLATYLGAPL